jgi:outer membrane protein TolC
MRKIAAVFIVLVLNGLTVSAQKMTLSDCLSKAIESNYGLKILQNEQAISKQNVNYSVFMPNLSLDGTNNNTWMNTVRRDASGNETNFNNVSSANFNASANLYWRLFDGAGMFFTYKKSKELLEISELNTVSELEYLIANVSSAYYNVWIQTKLLESAENIVQISQERYTAAMAKYGIGSLSGLEMRQSKIDLNADSSMLMQQRQVLTNAYIQLNTLMNNDLMQSNYVEDSLILLPMLDKEEINQNAVKNNTDLLIAKKGVLVSELNIKNSISTFFPTVDFNTGYQFSYANNPASITVMNRSNGFALGFTVHIPVFSKMENHRQIQTAKLARTNAELSYKELELNILSGLAELYNIYQNNLLLLDFENQNIEIAKESLESAIDKYRIGSLSGLEFREFQRSYIEAVKRLLNSSYQAKVSEIGLLLMSGKLK